MTSARDLVIVPAGDNSLHTRFHDQRNYDLWIVYYGQDEAKAAEYAKHCDRFFCRRGLKWELIRTFTDEHLSGDESIFEKYRYVFIPDDDLLFESGAAGINSLLDAAGEVDADIFQPAIANENWSKGWEPTRRVPSAHCRAANIVELMAPGYSGQLFSQVVLPVLNALEFQRAGWGLEPVIARTAEILWRRPVRTFVFDSTLMDHTRPPGQGTTSHQVGYDEAFLMPMIDSTRMREYGRFGSAKEARAFQFPFIVGTTDAAYVGRYMAWVRRARELINDYQASRFLQRAWKISKLMNRSKRRQ